MALSDKAKEALRVGLGARQTSDNVADEISAAIDAPGAQAAAVADIADPSTATAEDASDKINELLASLRVAGLLAP